MNCEDLAAMKVMFEKSLAVTQASVIVDQSAFVVATKALQVAETTMQTAMQQYDTVNQKLIDDQQHVRDLTDQIEQVSQMMASMMC